MSYQTPIKYIVSWFCEVANGLLASRATPQTKIDLLRSLFDKLPIVILISADGSFERSVGNLAAHRILGMHSRAGLFVTSLKDNPMAFQIQEGAVVIPFGTSPMEFTAKTGIPMSREGIELRTADGRSVVVDMHCVPLFMAEGLTHCLSAFTDVTEQRKDADRAGTIARVMARRLSEMVSPIDPMVAATTSEDGGSNFRLSIDNGVLASPRGEISIDHAEQYAVDLRKIVAQAMLDIVGGDAESTASLCRDVSLNHRQPSPVNRFCREPIASPWEHGSRLGRPIS